MRGGAGVILLKIAGLVLGVGLVGLLLWGLSKVQEARPRCAHCHQHYVAVRRMVSWPDRRVLAEDVLVCRCCGAWTLDGEVIRKPDSDLVWHGERTQAECIEREEAQS